MAAKKNRKRKITKRELINEAESNAHDPQEALSRPTEIISVDSDNTTPKRDSNDTEPTERTVIMQTPTVPIVFEQEVPSASAPYGDVGRVALKQRISNLVRGVQGFFASAKERHGAKSNASAAINVPDVAPAVDEDDFVPPVGAQDEDLITQINDRDREYMRLFPAHLKARVINKIQSREPEQNVVYQGSDHFETVMMNIHRDGYGLIDMEPYEAAFSSVWYRIGQMRTGKSAEVIMLMWEEGEHDETTTVMNWSL